MYMKNIHTTRYNTSAPESQIKYTTSVSTLSSPDRSPTPIAILSGLSWAKPLGIRV